MACPVRLVYDEAMPGDLLNILTDKLGLSKSGNLTPGGRISSDARSDEIS